MNEPIYKLVEFHREKEFEAVGWKFAFIPDGPLAAVGTFFIWESCSEPVLPEQEKAAKP